MAAYQYSTCRHYFKKCSLVALVVSVYVFNFLSNYPTCVADDSKDAKLEKLAPTVTIAVLVRNKAHTLPWFLGHIEKLDYPKNRISLWFRSDHNIDNSTAILYEWIDAVRPLYKNIDIKVNKTERGYPGEKSNTEWTDERFDHVISLRQEALDMARRTWSDYLFMLDADVILAHNRTFQILMAEDRPLVGPMLNTSVEGIYSNFWGGMTLDGYYKRTPNYLPIVDREKLGWFPVPMVHSALLFDLRFKVTETFSYSVPPEGYEGPIDDIIILAHTVKHAGVEFYVRNTEYFGTIEVPLDENYSIKFEQDQFTHTKLEAMVNEPELYHSPHTSIPDIPADKLGFDEVYMINLLRRPERRTRMFATLRDLGIKFKYWEAVDGQKLNSTYLDSLRIDMLPGYADPYSNRALTFGEIGCFLSHYFIWLEMIEKGYKKVLVLEDDVRFEPYFQIKFKYMMEEAKRKVPDWELIYLGRKILQGRQEELVEGLTTLVWPSYSYWTLSYLLTLDGARKLVAQKPLEKMIPVDEFLPIMFDQHPETAWKIQFGPRNLIGLSAEPLLVFPTHYTGEPDYISDTEDSHIIVEEEEAAAATQEDQMMPEAASSICTSSDCMHDEF